MRSSKVEAEARHLIAILLDTHTVTASEAAARMGISERTVRMRIKDANALLESDHLGKITAVPRRGLSLESSPSDRSKIETLTGIRNVDHENPQDLERMYLALRMILRSIKSVPVTVNELADALYVSAPTASKVLQECRKWLSGFHIRIKTVRSHGIEVSYEEQDYRQALKEFIKLRLHAISLNEELSYFFPGVNIAEIHNSVSAVEREWHFRFADASFAEILTFVSIATMENMRDDHSLSFHYDIDKLNQYNEYNFAMKIYQEVNRLFGLKTRPEEVSYLTVRILCSQVLEEPYADPEKLVNEYDQKLKNFVAKVIDVVSNVLNIDLTHDERLYNGLLNHIRALVFRLKFGQAIDNGRSGVSLIRQFPTTMRVGWLISTLFEQYFHMSLNDNELSYISLYIQSAIDSSSRPLKAILITNQNSGITRIMQERIAKAVVDIGELKVYTSHEFNEAMASMTDLVITTAPISSPAEKTVLLEDLFSPDNLVRIEDKIAEIRRNRKVNRFHFDAVCHQLFEPDLIMTNVSYENKQDLIKDMCRRLSANGYATRKYYSSVLRREKKNSTSIGQMVAIPHGDMSETNESKIVIATLAKPLQWGEDQVSIVFLLNILMKNESELMKWQAFYREFIKMTDSRETLDQIHKFTNPVDLYSYLIQ